MKDIVDVADVPTTAGCRAVERAAQPANDDAACLTVCGPRSPASSARRTCTAAEFEIVTLDWDVLVAKLVATADVFRSGVDDARASLIGWRQQFLELFDCVEANARPTLPMFPPRLDELTADSLFALVVDITRHVAVFNAAGTPCTAQPVPVRGHQLPASLQLVGPLGAEELLLTTAHHVEDATRA